MVSCNAPTPPSLVVLDDDTSLLLAKMPALSSAVIDSAPPASMVSPATAPALSIYALAKLLTLLLARMPPKPAPTALNSAEASDDVLDVCIGVPLGVVVLPHAQIQPGEDRRR